MVRALFANATNWSPKARDFMIGDGAADADVVFAAETHVLGKQRIKAECERFTKLGWVPRAAPAQLSNSSESGTQGGLLAGARKHLRQSRLAADEVEPFGLVSSYRNMLGIQISCQHTVVLIPASYHRGGLGQSWRWPTTPRRAATEMR